METSFSWVVNTCVSVTDKKNIQKYGNLSIESLEQCQIIIWGGEEGGEYHMYTKYRPVCRVLWSTAIYSAEST